MRAVVSWPVVKHSSIKSMTQYGQNLGNLHIHRAMHTCFKPSWIRGHERNVVQFGLIGKARQHWLVGVLNRPASWIIRSWTFRTETLVLSKRFALSEVSR